MRKLKYVRFFENFQLGENDFDTTTIEIPEDLIHLRNEFGESCPAQERVWN